MKTFIVGLCSHLSGKYFTREIESTSLAQAKIDAENLFNSHSFVCDVNPADELTVLVPPSFTAKAWDNEAYGRLSNTFADNGGDVSVGEIKHTKDLKPLTPTTPNWENTVESFLCRN